MKYVNSSYHWHLLSFDEISFIKQDSYLRCILSRYFQVLFILIYRTTDFLTQILITTGITLEEKTASQNSFSSSFVSLLSKD